MYKTLLFTKQSSLGSMFAESPVALIRPGHDKIASIESTLHPQLQEYIRGIQAKDGYTWVLVSAMGAGEWYGDNINGDYFPYKQLVTHTDDWLNIPVTDVEARQKGAAILQTGYPTFYLAHAFKHHINKNPATSFGDIVCAVWNEKMKRVELVIRLDHSRCEQHGATDILNRILGGDFVDVSMGCRVPYDVCSICGNKAKTKEEYCEHIRNRRLNRDPLGTGQKPYMINIRPRFFDLSFVFIGADKTARTLMKIASTQDQTLFDHIVHDVRSLVPNVQDATKLAEALYLDDYRPYERGSSISIPLIKAASVSGVNLYNHSSTDRFLSTYTPTVKLGSSLSVWLRKLAALQKENRQLKLSDIIKYVAPNPRAKDVSLIEGGEPDLPVETQDEMADKGLETAINASARQGVIFKPHEFLRIALRSAGLSELADKLQGVMPAPTDDVTLPCSPELGSSDSGLEDKLREIVMERSIAPPIIRRRVINITIIGPDDRGGGLRLGRNSLLNKVGAAYNGYRLWLLSNAPELSREWDNTTDLTSSMVSGSLDKTAGVEDAALTYSYLWNAYWSAGEQRA